MKAVKAENKNQTALLKEMLSKIRLDDPKVKSLIKQRNSNSRTGGTQKEIIREIVRRLKIQNKKLLEQVASLKDQVRKTKKDRDQISDRLNELQKLNKSLSDALGSCDICWGENSECVNCSGKGYPGWRTINRRLFNIYILPTLEKLYGLSRKTKKV